MAYQARNRDPLFDSDMQAAIERRGKELAGVLLMVLGALMMLSFWSYSPDDPSWMSATDAPVQNWLGRIGAGLAAPVFMVVGWGGWALAFLVFGWGLRFATHNGEDRLVSRLIFAPVLIAVVSLFAATLTAGDAWSHSFGLGGLFGDTVLGTVIGVAPDGSVGMSTLSLGVGLGMMVLGLFVLGFTRWELGYLARYALYLAVVAYVWAMRTFVRAVNGSYAAAAAMRARSRERAERRRAEAAEGRARSADEARHTAANAQEAAEEEQARLQLALDVANNSIASLSTELTSTQKTLGDTQTALDTMIAVTGARPEEFIVMPQIEGSVLMVSHAIDPGLISINRGANDGVKRGFTFDIFDGGQFKGRVRVETVEPDMCSAVIIKTYKSRNISQGDRAATRI